MYDGNATKTPLAERLHYYMLNSDEPLNAPSQKLSGSLM